MTWDDKLWKTNTASKTESSYGKSSVQRQENVVSQDGLPLFLFPYQAWPLYGTVRKWVQNFDQIIAATQLNYIILYFKIRDPGLPRCFLLCSESPIYSASVSLRYRLKALRENKSFFNTFTPNSQEWFDDLSFSNTWWQHMLKHILFFFLWKTESVICSRIEFSKMGFGLWKSNLDPLVVSSR